MDILKAIFPFSFTKKDSVASLIIIILIHLVASIVAGALIGILAKVPIVNLITGIVGSLVGLYFLAGLVLSILDYCKVLK